MVFDEKNKAKGGACINAMSFEGEDVLSINLVS